MTCLVLHFSSLMRLWQMLTCMRVSSVRQILCHMPRAHFLFCGCPLYSGTHAPCQFNLMVKQLFGVFVFICHESALNLLMICIVYKINIQREANKIISRVITKRHVGHKLVVKLASKDPPLFHFLPHEFLLKTKCIFALKSPLRNCCLDENYVGMYYSML